MTHLPPPTRLLLVHSPLVGPASWDLIAPALAEPGREVTIPDLTSTIAAGPPWCSRQAELIARAAAGRPAVLVGHSRAGPILAAAGALITQVRGYVFVDARLPFPGQTWMETAPPELVTQLREMADPDGWLPPWPRWWGEEALAELLPDPVIRERFTAGCPPLPLAMFTESAPAGAALARRALRVPAAERGVRGRGRPGRRTRLAGHPAGEPPSGPAYRPRGGSGGHKPAAPRHPPTLNAADPKRGQPERVRRRVARDRYSFCGRMQQGPLHV